MIQYIPVVCSKERKRNINIKREIHRQVVTKVSLGDNKRRKHPVNDAPSIGFYSKRRGTWFYRQPPHYCNPAKIVEPFLFDMY